MLDSFWRAAAYCLHPRVIALSLVPLVLMVGLALGLGYFFWEPAMDQVRLALESLELLNRAWQWLEGAGLGQLKTVLIPLVVIFCITPLIVVPSLLVVALVMTPLSVRLVAQRRFPDLHEAQGASWWHSVAWSLGVSVAALVVMVVSMPLWLLPPLILVLPPLIWGWLTYRVMAFDALATHASASESRALLRRHRWPLLAMGVLTGYMGAAPSVVWASGALFAAAFVLLVPLAIWIYTLVFVFGSLWFSHYCLAALQQMRSAESAAPRMPLGEVQPAAPVALAPVDSP